MYVWCRPLVRQRRYRERASQLGERFKVRWVPCAPSPSRAVLHQRVAQSCLRHGSIRISPGGLPLRPRLRTPPRQILWEPFQRPCRLSVLREYARRRILLIGSTTAYFFPAESAEQRMSLDEKSHPCTTLLSSPQLSWSPSFNFAPMLLISSLLHYPPLSIRGKKTRLEVARNPRSLLVGQSVCRRPLFYNSNGTSTPQSRPVPMFFG